MQPTTAVLILALLALAIFAFFQYQAQQRLAAQRTIGGGIGQLGAGIGTIVDAAMGGGGTRL